MKRVSVLLSSTVLLALTACGQSKVVVEAAIEQEGTDERVVLSQLPVRLLPYDRDAIFDSLEAAYDEPEPAIPPDLLAMQEQIQDAQAEWRQTEDRWTSVRDSLRELSEELQQRRAQRTTAAYQRLFRRFEQLEDEERALNQRKTEEFETFSNLQGSFLAQADSIRIARETWADRAFEDYDDVVAARLDALDREEIADTTNASGIARMNVPEGRWWVYARYTLPYEELYWNVPIEVAGDSTYLLLSRENAESRPVL